MIPSFSPSALCSICSHFSHIWGPIWWHLPGLHQGACTSSGEKGDGFFHVHLLALAPLLIHLTSSLALASTAPTLSHPVAPGVPTVSLDSQSLLAEFSVAITPREMPGNQTMSISGSLSKLFYPEPQPHTVPPPGQRVRSERKAA
jgi:hypothetical protein